MRQYDLDEAQKHLADLVEAALKGEEVFIKKDENHLVQLKAVQTSTAQPRRLPGSARGLITISPDFDDPLDDFKEYTH